MYGGDGQRNTETMKWNKSNRRALSRSLRLACLFSIFAIFPYLNEHHSFLSRDGASVIHHRQDTYRGGGGDDEDRTVAG